MRAPQLVPETAKRSGSSSRDLSANHWTASRLAQCHRHRGAGPDGPKVAMLAHCERLRPQCSTHLANDDPERLAAFGTKLRRPHDRNGRKLCRGSEFQRPYGSTPYTRSTAVFPVTVDSRIRVRERLECPNPACTKGHAVTKNFLNGFLD